jgi:eukaryotic-like serine/threonine-protein kinase
MARVGHYDLRELLGEGGIGRVYAGFDTVLEREVAIKSLRPELLNDGNFLARFRAEATSLARLNHPNITTVHALVTEGRNLYMVMERVRGETVEDLLKRRNGPLGVRECLSIVGQAADGLSYAHSMGVFHRDVKPANLMITEGGLVKIMDFGIARARGSQRLTRDGSIVGTLAYMAPEQLRGEPGDERSDLYSLAIVLYEILSGSVPFSGGSDYDLMQAQINTRPPPLGSTIPGVAGRVERALMRALAKKPDQRFATVAAFKDALGASASPTEAASVLEEAGFATSRRPMMDRLSSLLPAGKRFPIVVGAVLVAAALLLWGALTLILEPDSSPVTMNAPSASEVGGPYHAAGSSSAPVVGTPPSPSRALNPADVEYRRSVVLPPPGTATSPPLMLQRK